MSFMHNRFEPNESQGRDATDMHISKPTTRKTIRYVDTRAEMNDASCNLASGEVVVFRNIDPVILQWLIDFEWTDADEKLFEADSAEN